MASGRRVNVRKLFGCGLRQHSDQQHCEERGGLPESKKIPEDHLPINQRFLPLLFESQSHWRCLVHLDLGLQPSPLNHQTLRTSLAGILELPARWGRAQGEVEKELIQATRPRFKVHLHHFRH